MTCGRSTGPTNTQRGKVSPEKKENILGVTRCSAAKSTPERADCNVLPQNENCCRALCDSNSYDLLARARTRWVTERIASLREAAPKSNNRNSRFESSLRKR